MAHADYLPWLLELYGFLVIRVTLTPGYFVGNVAESLVPESLFQRATDRDVISGEYVRRWERWTSAGLNPMAWITINHWPIKTPQQGGVFYCYCASFTRRVFSFLLPRLNLISQSRRARQRQESVPRLFQTPHL